MRKLPSIYSDRANGRPMANSGGLERHRKRLRRQVKLVLRHRLKGLVLRKGLDVE